MIDSDSFDRRRFDQDLAAIRGILLWDWDPIGVGDEPEAASEYDAYAMRLYGILARGGSVADVAIFLAESGAFGLEPLPAERLRRVADALITLGVRLPSARPAG